MAFNTFGGPTPQSYVVSTSANNSTSTGTIWAQFYNPTGSGKAMYIQAIRGYVNYSSATSITFGTATSKLTPSVLTPVTPVAQPKLLGGAASVSQINGGNSTSGTPTGITTMMTTFPDISTNYQHINIIQGNPIIIPPSFSFHLLSQNMGTTGYTMFFQVEWYEQPI